MPEPPRILALIPAFNEEHNLGRVLDEIAACPVRVECLVINDGSSDETSSVARRHGVNVLDLPVNSGMFCALQAGFRYAHRRGYDVVVQVDADGQHDPSGIPALVEPVIREHVDVVIGSRFLGSVQYRMPLLRALGTRLFGRLTSWLVGQRITDTTCGFRAYGPAAIRLSPAGTTMSSAILLLLTYWQPHP